MYLARRQFLSKNWVQKRFAHDLSIRQSTGKVSIGSGPGGRSSVTGHTATVFGCTGFLGRYIVHKLAKQGTTVIVPFRDEDDKRHLKVMGDLGQVVPLEFDLRDSKTITECLRHSDIVFNLVGREWETKNFKYDDVHLHGAKRIAEIAAKNGVARFVQMSHLNANLNSQSRFYQSRAKGEQAVREVFPEATIVRPSTLFGHEDRFLNQMGVYPFVYCLNEGKTKVRPVYALDVASALEAIFSSEATIGQTYNLYGPKEYTYSELLKFVGETTLKPMPKFNIPKMLAKTVSQAADFLWWPTLSPDEIERRYIDDHVQEGKTFVDLGIEPEELESVALMFLRRYRSSAYFDQPSTGAPPRLRKGEYHVIE